MMETQHNTGASLISTTAGAQATSLMELILVRLKNKLSSPEALESVLLALEWRLLRVQNHGQQQLNWQELAAAAQH